MAKQKPSMTPSELLGAGQISGIVNRATKKLRNSGYTSWQVADFRKELEPYKNNPETTLKIIQKHILIKE